MNSNVRIALINATKNEYIRPPLGVLSLGTYLLHKKAVKRKNLKIVDVTLGDPLEFLVEFKPDVVGLSFLSVAHRQAFGLAQKLRQFLPESILVAGGIHISLLPELFKEPFDVGVIGEGEETLYELVKHIKRHKGISKKELRKVKGLVYRSSNHRLILTEKRPLIRPLDKIPFIDWSLLPEGYLHKRMVFVEDRPKAVLSTYMYFNRGCPFRCAFCTRPVFWQGLRIRKPETFAKAVEDLYRNYGVENIWLWDDTFVTSKEYLEKMIQSLKSKGLLGNVTFSAIGTRPDAITEEWAALLKKLGVISVLMGFESGSKEILKELKSNTMKVSDSVKAIEILEKYKINIWASFMVASPGETNKDLKATLKLYQWFINHECALHAAMAICTPLPGTDLWYEALEKGLVSMSMDWGLMKSHNPTRRPTKLFFKDRITDKEFGKFWSKTAKLRRELIRKHRQRDGWDEEYKEWIRYNNMADAQIRWYFFKTASFKRRFKKIISLWKPKNIKKYSNLLLDNFLHTSSHEHIALGQRVDFGNNH